jgi:hypothetical protein
MTALRPAPSSASAARALALAAGASATTVAGVFIAGGVITDDFRTAMALTAAWYLIAGAIALASLRASRSILAGYLIAAIATGGYLAATTLRDKTVHERVVTAEAPANVQESSGRFQSGEHATRGSARVVRLASGRRILTLTEFRTSPGPDLRVRIGERDLGALKGNRGDQQYELPRDLDPRNQTVQIWCRAFSALFGSARLQES